MRHHPCRQGVDEHALVADVRVLGRDLFGHLVPEDVAVARRVRLRRARDGAAALRGELERVRDHAADAHAREDARLQPDLELEPAVRPPADARVLALGVLAHEQHVDGGRARERRGHAVEQARWPEVRPQVEALAQRQQQTPERDVVGDGGVAHRAEEDGVVRADDVERVGRHHRPVGAVVVAAPGELIPLDAESERVHDLPRLGDDFRAGTVAADHGDAAVPDGRGHRRSFTVSSWCGRYGSTIAPSSTSSGSPSSSSAFARRAEANGTPSRNRAMPRPP
jgi:hypothetical protein